MVTRLATGSLGTARGKVGKFRGKIFKHSSMVMGSRNNPRNCKWMAMDCPQDALCRCSKLIDFLNFYFYIYCSYCTN